MLLAKSHVVLTPGGAGIQNLQDEYASHLHLLMWVSSLVLLIACANIANLLLVRGMARKTEMSVRTALGAMRWRIVRQLLTESLVLSSMGAVAGTRWWRMRGRRMLLKLAFPGAQNVPIQATPSLAVMGYAFGVAMATGILFGVAPAWIASQARPADASAGGSRGRRSAGATSCCSAGWSCCKRGCRSVFVGWGGFVCAQLEQERKHGHEAQCDEPVYRAHQSSGGGLSADAVGSALQRRWQIGFIPCRDVVEVGIAIVHADGGQQQRLGHAGAGAAQR